MNQLVLKDLWLFSVSKVSIFSIVISFKIVAYKGAFSLSGSKSDVLNYETLKLYALKIA